MLATLRDADAAVMPLALLLITPRHASDAITPSPRRHAAMLLPFTRHYFCR